MCNNVNISLIINVLIQLRIIVGCPMEHDCLWKDQAYTGDDGTSATISKHNETKIPWLVILIILLWCIT